MGSQRKSNGKENEKEEMKGEGKYLRSFSNDWTVCYSTCEWRQHEQKNPMQGVAYINSGLILVILVFL